MLISISKRSAQFKQNVVSWLLTLFALAGVYMLLQMLTLPQSRVEMAYFELLPLDVVNVQAFRALSTPAEALPKKSAIEAETVKPNLIAEKTAELDPFKILETTYPADMQKPNLPTSRVQRQPEDVEIQLNEGRNGIASRLVHAEVSTAELLYIPQPLRSPGGMSAEINLKIGETSDVKVEKYVYRSPTRRQSALEPEKPVAPDIDVPLKNVAELGVDFENLSPIYKALIEWMRRHPAELSPVVKTFMGYRQGDLTSRAETMLSGRTFGIFLVCHEKQYEIRICIVENHNATLLIDKGFRKRSNYLRVGTVSRDTNGRIFSFGTSQESASDARTREFYQIFLTWWELANQNESE